MAVVHFTLIWWLAYLCLSAHPLYFYPECKNMNCTRLEEMLKNLNEIRNSLHYITTFDVRVDDTLKRARNSVNFDDLLDRIHSLYQSINDKTGDRNTLWMNSSDVSKLKQHLMTNRQTVLEIEKQVDSVAKRLEEGVVEFKLTELSKLVAHWKEKEFVLRKALLELHERIDRLKGYDLGRNLIELEGKADKITSDLVNSSEYIRDKKEMDNMIDKLDALQKIPESLRLDKLLSQNFYATKIEFLSLEDTGLKNSLDNIQSRQDNLTDLIQVLNQQIMDNGLILDKLSKNIGKNTNK